MSRHSACPRSPTARFPNSRRGPNPWRLFHCHIATAPSRQLPPMSDNDSSYSNYNEYNEDSVPLPEKDIKHTHPGRPDLDYDDTPVGPAPSEDNNSNEQQETNSSEGSA